MMIRAGFAALALFLASSLPASAQSVQVVGQGCDLQEQRMVSALLTPIERHRIRRERIRVAAMEQRAKADGVVTRAERRQIRQAHRNLDARIRNARAS